jgi:hypothetical protein
MDVDCIGIQDTRNEKITRYVVGTPNNTDNWGQGGIWAELRNHKLREVHELITVLTGTLEEFKLLGRTGYHIGYGELSKIQNRQCPYRKTSNQHYYNKLLGRWFHYTNGYCYHAAEVKIPFLLHQNRPDENVTANILWERTGKQGWMIINIEDYISGKKEPEYRSYTEFQTIDRENW